MTSKQYKNIIQGTLEKCSDNQEDALSICRKILKNLGMPFPNGDYTEVLRVLLSNQYMGWKVCTHQQAAQCAEQGIPAIGISQGKAIVIAPEEAEVLTVEERMDMQFFAYAVIENQNLGLSDGIMQRSGTTAASSPRYAIKGVNIRKGPSINANVQTTIDVDSVLLVDKSVSSVKADGHEWIYVTYYKLNAISCESSKGWVARDYTRGIEKVAPKRADVFSELNENYLAHQRKMLINAWYIYNYFRGLNDTWRWNENPIYAMLGNMVFESGINPNKWQDGKTNVVDDKSVGYGLVQWSPANKYTSGLAPSIWADIDNQLERIFYEVRHEDDEDAQWSKKAPISFSNFTKSTLSVEVLAEYFVRYYENPSNVEMKIEGRQRGALMCQAWLREL